MNNGANMPVGATGLNKPQIGQPIQRPPNLAKQDSRKTGRKPTPNGEKKASQPKSPAIKKQREVTYTSLIIVQHQFRQTDLKIPEEPEDNTTPQKIEVEEPENNEQQEEEKPDDAPKEDEKQEEEQPPIEEEPAEPDNRSEEHHEEYNLSQAEDNNESTTELYDPNQHVEIKVNSKNKATTLKKIILESIGLYKKANIDLFKGCPTGNKLPNHQDEFVWKPFTEDDYKEQVKAF